MTTWRERGYVPASDGEDSDAELSTQEEPTAALEDLSEDENGSGGANQSGVDFMDIDDVPSDHLIDSNSQNTNDSELPHTISLVDPDYAIISLEEVIGGGARPVQDTSTPIGNDVEKDRTSPARFALPDPITEEPQPIDTLPTAMRVAPVNTDSPKSSEPSSPLSSPPGSPPSPPSSLLPPEGQPKTMTQFAVVVPTPEILPEMLRFTRPRSFRNRKPIQMNPYAVEEAKYKMTMKAGGVKPIRIRETQEQEARSKNSGEDSQDREFIAPPEEDDSQPRRRHADATPQHRINGVRHSGSNALPRTMGNDRPSSSNHIPSSEGSKRRKVGHTYSKKGKGRATAPHPSSPPQMMSTPQRLPGDIYDLPLSPSPSRPSRLPLNGRGINNEDAERPLPSSGTMKRVGLLSLLDNGDSDEDSPRRYILSSSPVIAPLSRPLISPSPLPLRPPSISIESRDRLRSRSPIGERNDNNSESTGSIDNEDSEVNSNLSSNEGPSKVVSRFRKRGTRGVLPASYIRLAKPPTAEPHRTEHSSTAPGSPEIRPGVARTRISNRPREPVPDLFAGDSDSGNSSDEPMLTASRPGKARQTTSSVPPRTVIDLLDQDDSGDDSDIPEDNRIDYGILGPSRKRTSIATQKRRPRQTKLIGVARTHTRADATSGERPRRSRATGTRPNPRRPAPRLGIVDLNHHVKNSATSEWLPQFARVAARSASIRPNLGRHSPSGKLIVLETAQDTQEARQVLRDWREGTLPFTAQDFPRRPKPRRQNRQSRIMPQSLSEDTATERHPAWQRPAIPTIPRPRAAKERQTSLLAHFPTPSRSQRNGALGRRNKPAGQSGVGPRGSQAATQQRPNRTQRPSQNPRLARENDFADVLQDRAPRPVYLGEENTRNAYSSPSPWNPPAASARAQPTGRIGELSTRPQRLRRKQTPVRVDVDTIERRQPSPEALVLDDLLPTQPYIPDHTQQDACLSGLLPYGSKYSLNFDTAQLKPGTIFNSELFIGNGLLATALSTAQAHVPASDRTSPFDFAGKSFHWGVFDNHMVTEFEAIIGTIGDTAEARVIDEDSQEIEIRLLESRAYSFYSFVTQYIANVLTFHDPLDVVSFSKRALQALETCCERIYIGSSDSISLKRVETRLALRATAFCLIIAYQIQRLCASQPDIQEKLELPRILRKIGRELVGRLARSGFEPIRQCYEDQRKRASFERGINNEQYVVELWVIAIRVLDNARPEGARFWDILDEELHISMIDKSLDVLWFEKMWRIVFTILPLYQFDNSGVACKITQEQCPEDNWALVKAMVGRTLKVYNANKEGHSGTTYDYLRVLYSRCHHFLTKWFWRNPELVIPVLYEFFASNGLANLKREEDRGHPEFLYNLDKSPSLDATNSDQCFHLLLKFVGAGLHQMRATSTTRKIRGLVFRLMPNHRRQYPKDKDLRVEHLAALKNHHYLLETLFWAAPPDCRPPLEAIRTIVDPETSHRSACNVAVRAWTNLMRFQLQSGEGVDPLKEFMGWFDYLVEKTLGQHHAARSDAERQYRLAQEKGDRDISESQVEDNIRRNQRQVEAILNDLVTSLATSIGSIRGQTQSAIALLTKSASATLLNSFTRIGHKLVLEVLNLLQQFIRSSKKVVEPPSLVIQPSIVEEEDSQDFGDWSALNDYAMEDMQNVHNEQDDEKKAAEHFLLVSYGSLNHLVSNCFGGDKQPEETLLMKTVDTWCEVAGFMVRNRLKSWSSYLDYSSEAWSRLRDTPQTRKFASYFMPKLIEAGEDVYQSNKSTLLRFWMKSLVERESMLEYQNVFTAALLNVDSDNIIFSNAPFSRGRDGNFLVSQVDFRCRRLSLISTVFERMRISYETATGNDRIIIKGDYSDMLKSLMRAVRSNYEELQSNSMSGAYVDFAHRVIELLQQYTTEITEIDRYFTDSSAFPLPAGDPDYVAGRLKRYTPKLARPGTQKELNMFLQTLCERSALDNGDSDLVGQFLAALCVDVEVGDLARPTMRAYFLHAVFPAYMEVLFRHRAGWIMAIPLLRTLGQVMYRLPTAIDSASYLCVQSVWSQLETTLDAIRSACSQSLTLPDAFSNTPYIGALTLLLRATAAAIPTISLLSFTDQRTGVGEDRVQETVAFLLRFAHYARKAVIPARARDEAERPLDILGMSAPLVSAFEAGRRHCQSTLIASLNRQWVQSGTSGGWTFMQGQHRRAVSLPLVPSELWGGDVGGVEEVGGMNGVQREFGAAVRELLSVAARTEMFETAVRDVDERVWEFEGRAEWPLGDAARTLGGHGRRVGRASKMLSEVFI